MHRLKLVLHILGTASNLKICCRQFVAGGKISEEANCFGRHIVSEDILFWEATALGGLFDWRAYCPMACVMSV